MFKFVKIIFFSISIKKKTISELLPFYILHHYQWWVYLQAVEALDSEPPIGKDLGIFEKYIFNEFL